MVRLNQPSVENAQTFYLGEVRVERLSRSPVPSAEAVIVFHGFPGPSAASEPAARSPKLRLELSKALVASRGMDVFLPGYAGLGESRGRFTFERSVSRSRELAQEISGRGYGRVHVLGHSWGAFVAVNAFQALGAAGGSLVLLAGLLDLPNEAAVREFLAQYRAAYPGILGESPEALERTARDLDLARRAFNPMALAPRLRGANKRPLLIHGTLDAEVCVAQSRRFSAAAGGTLLELEADHGFTGRFAEVIGAVEAFLAMPVPMR